MCGFPPGWGTEEFPPRGEVSTAHRPRQVTRTSRPGPKGHCWRTYLRMPALERVPVAQAGAAIWAQDRSRTKVWLTHGLLWLISEEKRSAVSHQEGLWRVCVLDKKGGSMDLILVLSAASSSQNTMGDFYFPGSWAMALS